MLELAGPVLALDQAVEWFSIANEAAFYADRWFAPGEGLDGAVEVDLSRMGRLAEVIQVNLPAGGRQASDVTTVAQTAAAKIDTVVGG